MNKQQLVESIISEIMKGVSRQIREMVREEIDIERKRLRKQLLEEFRQPLEESRQPSHRDADYSPPPRPTRKKIDTGDHVINSILDDIQTDMNGMAPDIRFQPEATISDVSGHRQPMTETRRAPGGPLWKPESGEGFNFNPLTMDPAQIDWSSMVEALDQKKALPGDRK